MKRVECECGRMVRIDTSEGEADRALCPYCGAKLARQPDDEPAASPAEEAKSPAVSKGLLVVAAVLALLLLAGGVTAVVLLKKDKPAKETTSTPIDPAPLPKSATPAVVDKPTAKAKDPLMGPFTLRLTAPRKKGDVREVVLKGETVTRFTVVETDKRDPEPPKTTKVHLECAIRTLEVDDAGREKAWQFTIVAVQISRLAPAKLPASGAVIEAKVSKAGGDLEFTGAADLPEPLKAALTRAAGRRLGSWPTTDEDAMFSSTRPQMPGTSWTANEEALSGWFTGVTEVVWDRASGKLVEVVKAGPYAVVEAQFEAHGKVKDKTPSGLTPVGASVNELTGKVQYRLPLHDFRGPTLIASRVEVVSKDEGKNGVGSEELLSDDFTLEIRYLTPDIGGPAKDG